MCATLGNVGLYAITKGVVSRVGGLSLSASARGTSEARYICVMAGTDAAKAKCKAVRNRAFSMTRMTR